MKLSKKIKLNLETIFSPNLAGLFSEDDQAAIATNVYEGFIADDNSRMGWMEKMEKAMDLVMQVKVPKSFPWPDAANVTFPLVTISTLQFHSRAYPALIQSPKLVHMSETVPNMDVTLLEKAKRISRHMSWQLLEEDSSWEPQQDQLLIHLPVIGCAFKKTYYSPQLKRNTSELVLAKDLIVNYFTTSMETCPRVTHRLYRQRNDIHTSIMNGEYLDVRDDVWYQGSISTEHSDQRYGTAPPPVNETTPFTILEQHTYLDLDGDGYAEPYIVTIELASRKLLRLVSRIEDLDKIDKNANDEIIRITPEQYFTKYTFIPSPDGGFYDMGFGLFLSPLNSAVNTLVNQLIDAGTMSNAGGGFLGRGAKIRGGTYTFSPMEWKRVDATGDDLKKSIFPLPVREPSQTLFQLLSLLINYTERVAGSTDTLSGENPGQNTKTGTMEAMIEQGLQIYSAIYKRIWRAMREEFKKLYLLNARYLPESKEFPAGFIRKEDYSMSEAYILPVADPMVINQRQKMQKAGALKQAAMTTPGYDLEVVEHNFLSALEVDNIDLIYPGPKKTPPLPNPKMMVEQVKLQGKQMDMQAKTQIAHAKLEFEARKLVAELQLEAHLNEAKIIELEAKATHEMAKANGVEAGHQIAAFEATIGALKLHNESMSRQAELLLKSIEVNRNDRESGVGSMAGSANNTGSSRLPQTTTGGTPGAMDNGALPGGAFPPA